MLAPELVQHLQRDLPLGHAHGVRTDLRRFGGHVLVEFFQNAVYQNLVVHAVFCRPLGDRQTAGNKGGDGPFKTLDIPLRRVRPRRNEACDQILRCLLPHIVELLGQVF